MPIRNYYAVIEVKPGKFAYIQDKKTRVAAYKNLEKLEKRWNPPNWFYHFARGGHIAAIQQHLDQAYFGRLDIHQFFPSITKNHIIRALVKVRMPFLEASQFAADSVVKVGGRLCLPYGFVQSSHLASLVLDKSALGVALRKERARGIRLTVFMDDILVSGTSQETVGAAMKRIHQAAAEASLAITDKVEGPARKVTAFNIEFSHREMRVTDDRMLDFRQKCISAGKTPRSAGVIGYVATVNSEQAKKLESEIYS
jgi:hypothetical protein